MEVIKRYEAIMQKMAILFQILMFKISKMTRIAFLKIKMKLKVNKKGMKSQIN